MRSDIFPIEICDALAGLRLKSPSHSFEDTCTVIENAFGVPIDDIFDRFYIDPVASGSIAQVHRAQINKKYIKVLNEVNGDTKDTKLYKYHNDIKSKHNWEHEPTFFEYVIKQKLPELLPDIFPFKGIKQRYDKTYNNKIEYIDVAVKVRHPSILQNMAIDIGILYFLTNFISKLPGCQGLKVPIYEPKFAEYLASQIDLEFEGESLTKFYDNFNKHDSDAVIFPKPIKHLIKPSVLVETWEEGVTLSDIDLEKLSDSNRLKLAKKCYDVFMKMCLRDNFVHGDCHSGNILIRAKEITSNNTDNTSLLKDKSGEHTDKKTIGKREIDGELVFLDAGLTASLTDKGIQRFGVLMGHIATGILALILYDSQYNIM